MECVPENFKPACVIKGLITIERGSKPLSGFFDGKEYVYGSLRNPRFSLRRSLFLTSAYGAYGGNVESPK